MNAEIQLLFLFMSIPWTCPVGLNEESHISKLGKRSGILDQSFL